MLSLNGCLLGTLDTPCLTGLEIWNQPDGFALESSLIAAIAACTALKELSLPGYPGNDDLSALATLPLEVFSCMHGPLLLAILG